MDDQLTRGSLWSDAEDKHVFGSIQLMIGNVTTLAGVKTIRFSTCDIRITERGCEGEESSIYFGRSINSNPVSFILGSLQ